MKKVEHVEIDENGDKVFNIGADLASADPAVYGRLIMAGKYEEAKAMLDTPMYNIEEGEEWENMDINKIDSNDE